VDLRGGGDTDEGAIGNPFSLANSSCSESNFASRFVVINAKGDAMIQGSEHLVKQLVLETTQDINPLQYPAFGDRHMIPVEYLYGKNFIFRGNLVNPNPTQFVKCKCSNQPCDNWFFHDDTDPPIEVIPVWTTELVLSSEPSYTRRFNILNWIACTVDGLSFSDAKTRTRSMLKKRRTTDCYIQDETARLTVLNTVARNCIWTRVVRFFGLA